MRNHPIVEVVKKERQHETIEQTRTRARRYVERQKAMTPTDDAPLYKATGCAPLSERDLECSRCHEMKAVEDMAKKDAKTLRSYCKACHAVRMSDSRRPTDALTKATTCAPLSEDAEWQAGVARHREALRARGGYPVSAELRASIGQAAEWFREVPVFREYHRVAQQIARLCGDDSEVVTTFRSVADAAQLRRDVSDHAIVSLIDSGWLSAEPAHNREGTWFRLCVGNTDHLNLSQEDTDD